MSAFNNYHKDDIVESIQTFTSDLKDKNPNIPIGDIIKEIMEAVSCGIERAIWEVENNIK